MPDTAAPIPASPNFEKLKTKLRELFELDKADLDFGIYRVLRQRHTEIAEFLDNHRKLRKKKTSAMVGRGSGVLLSEIIPGSRDCRIDEIENASVTGVYPRLGWIQAATRIS